MGDSLMTVIVIILAAIVMFIFPLMSISERNDDIAQLSVQTSVIEFVDDVRTTGKITEQNYNKLLQELVATGNSYEVEIEVKKLDENPGKKSAIVVSDKIGENLYYSVFTTEILDKLNNDSTGNKYPLNEGDIISVTVKNNNKTIAQMLRSFFYKISGSDNYVIAAQHSGIVMATSK